MNSAEEQHYQKALDTLRAELLIELAADIVAVKAAKTLSDLAKIVRGREAAFMDNLVDSLR